MSEIIERSDPKKGEFSPSSLQTYMRCPRMWYIQKGLQIVEKEQSANLGYGTWLHAGVEWFSRIRAMEREAILELFPNLEFETPHTAAKLVAIKKIVEASKETPIAESHIHSLDNAIVTMDRYCENYKDDPVFSTDAELESMGHLPMPNDTVLFLRIDRVRRDGNTVGILDTKTTKSSLTPYFFNSFQNSFQLSAYFYYAQQVLGRCDYVQIDAIKVPPPQKANAVPFARETFMRTEVQMADFLNTYYRMTEEIKKGLNLPEKEQLQFFNCMQTACGDYGGCAFLGLCTHGLEHPSMRVDFDFKGEKNGN